MHKITDNIISEEILLEIGVKKEETRIINKLNEFYQYHPKTFNTVNKGDYSLLSKLVYGMRMDVF